MKYRMCHIWFWSRQLIIFFLFTFVEGLNEYTTPSRNNEFNKFMITDSIPSDGTTGSGAIQSALTIGSFSRVFFTFNFRGKGPAQILIQEDSNKVNDDALTVEIGGGTNSDEITIYDGRLGAVITQTTITNITSEDEFRSFWLTIDPSNQDIYFGTCNDPSSSQALQTTGQILDWTPLYLSLSTTNTGEWQFPSDGEILGGCKPTVTECSDNSTQCATNGSSLQGTCIYPSEQVPGGFGSGVCRPVCGTVVCGNYQACFSGTCADIATSTMSTSTMSTTATTSSTPSTTSSTTSTTSTTPSTTSTTSTTPSTTTTTSTTPSTTSTTSTTPSTTTTTSSTPSTTSTTSTPLSTTSTTSTTPSTTTTTSSTPSTTSTTSTTPSTTSTTSTTPSTTTTSATPSTTTNTSTSLSTTSTTSTTPSTTTTTSSTSSTTTSTSTSLSTTSTTSTTSSTTTTTSSTPSTTSTTSASLSTTSTTSTTPSTTTTTSSTPSTTSTTSTTPSTTTTTSSTPSTTSTTSTTPSTTISSFTTPSTTTPKSTRASRMTSISTTSRTIAISTTLALTSVSSSAVESSSHDKNVNIRIIAGAVVGGAAFLAAVSGIAYKLGQARCHCGKITPSGERRSENDDSDEETYSNVLPSSSPGQDLLSQSGARSPVSLVDLSIGEQRLEKYIHWNDF